MAAVEERKLFSELEEGTEPAASAQAIDLSFIHWGYLNSTLLTDQSKRTKDLTWKTYWVDLCGSTLRLYRDLSLNPDSGNYPPPSKVIGPTTTNEKKEAFLVLKKGASISIPTNDEFRPRKKSKKMDPPRNNVFKLQVINSNNSPVYFFEAPSKGSMYRWISKIEEGIGIADSPQNPSSSVSTTTRKPTLTYLRHLPSYRRLKEAKLLALESRRYQNIAPELKYSDNKDDTDSGMEGDVEESSEFQEKPPPDPRLVKLLHQLRSKEELLELLGKGEKAFVGDSGELSKVCEFKATSTVDYYLVQGYSSTLMPKGSRINVLGQLPNGRWRCYVDLPKTLSISSSFPDISQAARDISYSNCSSEATISSTSLENSTLSTECTERLLGSVPSSLLLELDEKETSITNGANLSVLPMGTPDVTPNMSPCPSPPQSPYSPHKSSETSQEDQESPSFVRRSPTNLQRFVPSMDLSDVDAWEQFLIPSPPSTPVTSRSTTPSLSLSDSLDTLDGIDQVEDEAYLNTSDDRSSSVLSNDVPVTSSVLLNDVPVTCIGSAPDDHSQDGEKSFSPVDTSSPVPSVVAMRHKDVETLKPNETPKNYSFLVTKKLRQRGISLIVGSSSSEDDDDEDFSTGGYKSKITRRKLDEELERFAAVKSDQAATLRPYSAFVPRKSTTVNFGIRPTNVHLRTATTDDLLRDYSSSNLTRSNACVTFKSLQGGPSCPENVPPINQRRTIQLYRGEKEGFGFTLQTYGIVQQNGEVEYMTFVLTVEEDGPAYMAGMRPGDIIITIENRDVEEADHKTLVELLQKSSSTVRMVVVFVDAIRRMHLNTKIKVLRTELYNREEEFKHLCKREREILTRNGDPSTLAGFDLDVLSPTRSDSSNSYLYTTELTSSFAKNTPKVIDSLVKYRQHVDDKPRRTSLPDQSELTKQRLISTTGTQLLRSFASSAESVLKKSASIKLKKKIQKTKQTAKTFKSYLELDEEGGEGPIETSSPKHKTSKKTTEPARLSWPRQSKGSSLVGQDDTGIPVFAESGKISPLAIERSREECDKVGATPSTPSKANNSPKGTTPATKQSTVTRVASSVPSTAVKTKPFGNSVDTKAGHKSFPTIRVDTPQTANCEDRPSSPGELLRVVTNTPKTALPDGSSSMSPLAVSESLGDLNLDSSHDGNTNSSGSVTGPFSIPSKGRNAEQKRSELLRQTKTMDTKVTNDVKSDANNEKEHELKNSPRTDSTCKTSPLVSGNTNVDRSCTTNIASLRKLFEAQSSPSPDTSNDAGEESDVFPTGCNSETALKRPQITRTRLGSRPVSYIRAMDAAEESPLIPEDTTKEKLFESSA